MTDLSKSLVLKSLDQMLKKELNSIMIVIYITTIFDIVILFKNKINSKFFLYKP